MNYKVSFCVGCGFVSGILLVVFSSSPFNQPLCDLSNTEITRRMSVMALSPYLSYALVSVMSKQDGLTIRLVRVLNQILLW